MFKIFSFLIKKLIILVEKIEYNGIDLDESDISKKIIKTLDLNGFKVKSDTGYEKFDSIHITQPYKNIIIKTDNFTLNCADLHIVFDEYYNEVYVKDLNIGDKIQTLKGLESVNYVSYEDFKTSMFDLTVCHPNHRMYTNGILSHNTISASIFMLHTILFNNDKNIMIVANKGETAIEIVDKVKSIYTLLPFFLKPGVKIWNQKSLTFENGCRIKTSARTKTPAIGFTIDVLYLDEFAHIPSNIIEPYYTAAFPTVSAISNSKIIITSTPNGMNLFHKLLINAERPEGDPNKNNYKPMRVYWYQVPGRFVTYIRLNNHKLYENGLTKEKVFDILKEKWGNETKLELKWNLDLQKDVINVYNNDKCKDIDVKSFKFLNKNDVEISLNHIGEVTTWKEEAIKDIGGEDAFNQEYGLRFINASKSLLNESIIEKLIGQKSVYSFIDIDVFEKLKFSYENLLWIEDNTIYDPNKRNNYKFILSIDLSEGLGQDFSVINIFKISNKPKELIELQKKSYKSIIDYFRLEQVGMYRSNVVSIKQIAELLYILVFEYLNPDNVKIVLELNTFGSTLLSELPHVFDGNNNYGSFVFFRYKHRIDSNEEKIGIKINSNKNLLVKDYQDLMTNGSYYITNSETINEITTFIKQTTSSGNIRYAADSGNDDTVMTIVNSTSIFDKVQFKQMVEDYMENDMLPDIKAYINDSLNEIEYIEAIDYSQLLDIRRKVIRNKRANNNSNPFNNYYN